MTIPTLQQITVAFAVRASVSLRIVAIQIAGLALLFVSVKELLK